MMKYFDEKNKISKLLISLFLTVIMIANIAPIAVMSCSEAAAQVAQAEQSSDGLNTIIPSGQTMDTPASQWGEIYTVTLDVNNVLPYYSSLPNTHLNYAYIGILTDSSSTDYEIVQMERTDSSGNSFMFTTVNTSIEKVIFLLGKKTDISLDRFEAVAWSASDNSYTASYIATTVDYDKKLLKGYWEGSAETKDVPSKIYYDNTLSGRALLNYYGHMFTTYYTSPLSNTSASNAPLFGDYCYPNVPESKDFKTGTNIIYCDFTSSSDPSLPTETREMIKSSDFPDSPNAEHLYETDVPQGYDTVQFRVDVSTAYPYSALQIIPTEYINPCYFGGSCAYDTNGVKLNNGRGGTWGEVTDVNDIGDYTSLLYKSEPNTMYTVDENGDVQSNVNGVTWIKATLFDYYNDLDLSGVIPTAWTNTTATYYNCENLNEALSAYYTEQNKRFIDGNYYQDKMLQSTSNFSSRVSFYSQEFGIINPLYTISFHSGLASASMASTTAPQSQTAATNYCYSWNLFGMENTVVSGMTDAVGRSYTSNSFNRFFTNNYGGMLYGGSTISSYGAVQGLYASKLDSNGNICANVADPENLYTDKEKEVVLPYFDKEFLRGNNSLHTALGNVYDVYFPFIESKSETTKNGALLETITLNLSNLSYMNYDPETDEYYIVSNGSSGSNFYPLNYAKGKPTSSASSVQNGINNHSFGMRFDIEFTDYIICNNIGANDDCVIYVDGELVYDGGGCHNALLNSILQYPVLYRTPVVTSSSLSTKNFLAKNGDFVVNDKGDHTMTVFYMERGMNGSTFNFKLQTAKRTELSQNMLVEQSISNLDSFTPGIQSLLKEKIGYVDFDMKLPTSSTDSLESGTSSASGTEYKIKSEASDELQSGVIENDSFKLRVGDLMSLPEIAANEQEESFVYLRQNLTDFQKQLLSNTKWSYQITKRNIAKDCDVAYYPASSYSSVINGTSGLSFVNVKTGEGNVPTSDDYSDRVRLYNPGVTAQRLSKLSSIDNVTSLILDSTYTYSALFENDIKCGTVTINKVVENDAADNSDFTFKIVYDNVGGENLALEGSESFEDTFTVAGNSSKTISIPIGTSYTITEISDEPAYQNNAESFSGTVTNEEYAAEYTFTNTKNFAEKLTIQKTVQHSNGTDMTDTDEKFTQKYDVIVTLSSARDNLYSRYSEDGWTKVGSSDYTIQKTFSISMSDGEVTAAVNIPVGTTYTVEEADSSKLGYEVTNGYLTGAFSSESPVKIAVTNKLNEESKNAVFYIQWDDGGNLLNTRPEFDTYKTYCKLQYLSENGTWNDWIGEAYTPNLTAHATDSSMWVYTIENLPKYGGASELKYRLVQTTVPDSYITAQDTAEENGTITNVLLGTLTITSKGYNKNLQTESLITDIKYAVYETKEDAINKANAKYSVTTGSDGTYQLTSIPLGDYWIIQAVTPDGYSALEEKGRYTVDGAESYDACQAVSEPIKVTVSANNNSANASLVTYNTMLDQLPETGGMGVFTFLSGAALLILVSLLIFVYNKDRKHMRKTTDKFLSL